MKTEKISMVLVPLITAATVLAIIVLSAVLIGVRTDAVPPDDPVVTTETITHESFHAGSTEFVALPAETTAAPKSDLLLPCDHTFSNWRFYDCACHVRHCQRCSLRQYEEHMKVQADGNASESCAVCRDSYISSSFSYGHDTAYVIDSEYLEANGHDELQKYYHVFRCVRTDDDGQYACDYVQVRENCSFTELFWDAESGGEHELYYQCPMCYVAFYWEPEICYFATQGLDCYRCTNPHPGY